MQERSAKMEIHQLVRQIRLDNGMSQEKFAKAVNISDPYVSQIENGRRSPGDDLLKRIAAACGGETAEEKAVTLKQLRLSAQASKRPELTQIIQEAIEEEYSFQSVRFGEIASKALCDRIKNDVRDSGVNMRDLGPAIGLTVEYLKNALRRDEPLGRARIVNLAKELGQSESEYLILGGYLPEELRGAEKPGSPLAVILQNIGRLTATEIKGIADMVKTMAPEELDRAAHG